MHGKVTRILCDALMIKFNLIVLCQPKPTSFLKKLSKQREIRSVEIFIKYIKRLLWVPSITGNVYCSNYPPQIVKFDCGFSLLNINWI
jgi:hypothetical protein